MGLIPPPVNRMTDACENIIFLQLLLLTVKYFCKCIRHVEFKRSISGKPLVTNLIFIVIDRRNQGQKIYILTTAALVQKYNKRIGSSRRKET